MLLSSQFVALETVEAGSQGGEAVCLVSMGVCVCVCVNKRDK